VAIKAASKTAVKAPAPTEAAPPRITVLEALATEAFPTGPNMSNRTTPPAADADDQ
jgi:hypothetical protein